MLPRKYRLKKRTAFNATYKTGKAVHKGGITLFCGKLKHYGDTKIGFVVSKKIHKRAVKRNRIKRVIREAVRLYIKSKQNFNTKYMSLIFAGSIQILEKDFFTIKKTVEKLMEEIEK